MITIYLIQACLFILGVVPFLCELSKHFHDSILTILSRLSFFITTVIGGYYVPSLKSLPDTLLIFITLFLLIVSYQTIKGFIIFYQQK